MQIKLNLLKNPQEINILGLGRDELLSIMTDFESQPKRASMRVSQLWSWIYCHGISSFDKMTNIDKKILGHNYKSFDRFTANYRKKKSATTELQNIYSV